MSRDLDPDEVSGVSMVVGKSPASISKWVCPRFRCIFQNHRMQNVEVGGDGGGHRFPSVPRKGAKAGALAAQNPGPWCPWEQTWAGFRFPAAQP